MSGVRIIMLGGFRVFAEAEPLSLPNDAQRLIAYLALRPFPLLRQHIAGTLWEECPQDRADGNLRTALWRTRSIVSELIATPEPQHLAITPDATIDVSDLTLLAQRIVLDSAACLDDELDPTPFTLDLLPGWYDDWVVVQREHFRQLCLHALEAISAELLARDHLAQAMDAGMTAVDLDPLRESAHRCVIRVHLAEGNRSEALFEFDKYRRVLHRELGIAPSEQLTSLLGDSDQ